VLKVDLGVSATGEPPWLTNAKGFEVIAQDWVVQRALGCMIQW
jgi:hypothetical protein